ncbi:MAG: asparagine synthase (glutamine-hydrolyzing) [Candidatus Acidiferrales bacterium]
MCGICGAIGIAPVQAGETVVRQMLAALVHRGPDDEGILSASRATVGMRRLSIIDLPGGGQPVWNEAGTIAVLYNGEIYNFQELRAELESAGHSFRTKSDTEVIVHAYEAWGEECPKRFHGMFAFAIVEMPDGATGRATKLFLARDPVGIKPLYYAVADGAFFFASEVRALLASGRISPRISSQALPSYLLFGSVGEPATLIDNVRSLPPGHSLSIPVTDRVSAAPLPKAYWDPGAEFRMLASTKQNGGIQNAKTLAPAVAVRALLENSVRGHLIADVPIGIFLSSGIDSTALAAIASSMQAGIHTFTVAFPDAEYSEAEIARRTAARLGTEHTEFTLSLADMVSRLNEAVASFDQPSMDGVNSYFVSWAARQAGLKVALSGLGSDELFGGYTAFRATSKVARVAGVAPFVPRAARVALLRATSSATQFGMQPDAFRKATAAWLDPKAFPDPYFFTRLLFAPERVASALHQSPPDWTNSNWSEWLATNAAQSAPLDSFTQISWLELRSYMTSTLLRDTDAMSMASSLEVRVPFLDVPLVKYVLSLPESAKRNAVQPKSLLIAALGDLLPQEVVSQTKRTFTFPWETWLRGSLGKRVGEGLAHWSPALEPHLSRNFAMDVWKEFQAGRTTWSRPWSLYVLNEWVKRHVNAANSNSEPSVAQSTAR